MTNITKLSSETFKNNPYGEKYLYSVNRNTFAQESSVSVYNRHFSEKLFNDENLYIICGTDSGLLASYIINKKTPKDTRYLFIELPHIIEQVKSILPEDYDDSTFSFTTPDEWQVAAEELELNIYIYKDKVQYIKSLGVADAYLLEYSATNLQIVQSLESVFFFTRAMVGVFPFMIKQLMNICDNRYSSTLLNNVFTGKTCVILAGGPSLDDDIEWVKANQHNIAVIAVSRISKTLLKHNITPHMIVSVDPYDVSFDVSKEQLALPKEVLFIQANCVNPSLLSQWRGKNVCIGTRFPWDEASDKNCSIMGGPTVTNTALKALIEMGFSNILLSGVDLCYSKTGISHAADSIEANEGPVLGQPGIWVDTYAGDKAETQIAFGNAITSLSKQALEAKQKDVTIYNLSPNAAVAEHIEHIPTSALTFENEQDNIWQLIDSVIPKDSTDFIRQDNNFVLDKVSKMLKQIQEVKSLAVEALECNELLFKDKGKESENFKYKLRMDKIEKKFDSHYKRSTRFIKNFGLNKFITSAQTSHDEWTDKKIEETGKLYYQAYVDSSKTLINLLKETTQRINCRIEEEKNKPNFQLLFEQWQGDEQFGRAMVWKESALHQSKTFPVEFQPQYNECVKSFNEVMANDDCKHLEVTKQEASLDGVRRKIIILFHQHNIDGLRVITNSLQLHKESDKKCGELYLLAHGYSAILSKEYEQARNCFEQLPTELIGEDELQQIVSISINLSNDDMAEAALKSLSELADFYQPQYAKILQLLGKSEASIDIYSQYLENHPNDLKTWHSLGKLYYDINALESAQMAFEYVVLKEPGNISAQEYLNKLHK